MPDGMIAFYLPGEAAQHLYEQVAPTLESLGVTPVPPNEYHLTLVYLGEQVDPNDLSAISSLVTYPGHISGKVAGVGRFEKDDLSVIYASFDAESLPVFRQYLLERLQENGFGLAQEHGFTPHITLAYVDPEIPIPDVHLSPFSITFPRLTVAVGDAQTHIEVSRMPETLIEKAWLDAEGDLHVPVRALPFYGPEELGGKDLDNEFFDAETDTGPLSEAIATFNHAKESEIFGDLSGKYLGIAKRVGRDEFGWMYEVIVERRNRYKDFIKKLIDDRLVDISTTPFQIPAAKSRQPNGYYKDWWITEVTFTPHAANPNAVVLIQKSLKELVMPEDNGSNPGQAPVQETPAPADGGLAAEIEKAFADGGETPAESPTIPDLILAVQKSVADMQLMLMAKIDAIDKKVTDTQTALPVLGKQMAQHVSKSLGSRVAEEAAKSNPEKAAEQAHRASVNSSGSHVSNEFGPGAPGNW